jgi:hypothetical protein
MKIINLKTYRGQGSSLFTGRPQGKKVRELLLLDSLDLSDENITLKIPIGTTSINPSFYLGLLYESIKKLGESNFKKKYTIIFEEEDPEIKKLLQNHIDDGFRSATNTINNLTGFTKQQ